MNQMSFVALAVAASFAVALVTLIPAASSAQARCPPAFSDRYGCTLHYDPTRGDPGPGNGSYWQGEPTDHRSIQRRGYYRGNDPDNFIRQQLMRDK